VHRPAGRPRQPAQFARVLYHRRAGEGNPAHGLVGAPGPSPAAGTLRADATAPDWVAPEGAHFVEHAFGCYVKCAI